MAGIAPLGGSPTSTALQGTAATVPGTITPPYATPQQNTPAAQSASFTAFPSSYDGFGTNGSAFGTLGVSDGKLTIVSTPAGSLPPPGASPGGLGSTLSVTESPAASLPNTPTAPAPAATAGATPATPGTPGTQNQDPPPVNPAQGLLGSPPTNPIVIQAEAQEAAAAQAAQEAATQAAEQRAAEQTQVQQLQFRIAAAYADNDQAAAAQIQPAVTKLEGQIQGQTWAGLGTTPPKPFALPEIPTVFLNIAS